MIFYELSLYNMLVECLRKLTGLYLIALEIAHK